MIALIGYALLSLITAIILSPIIKFGRELSTYLCVFGMVYFVLLFISPTSYFEPNWFKYIGYGIASLCIITFVFLVWKKMKKQQQFYDARQEEKE